MNHFSRKNLRFLAPQFGPIKYVVGQTTEQSPYILI